MFLVIPGFAVAHGFGQRYDLPLPLWLFVLGAGATVALSFVTVLVFFRKSVNQTPSAWIEMRPHRWVTRVAGIVRWIVIGFLLLSVVAGFLGDQNPVRNILPVVVWIVWWVGLALLSALGGNVYEFCNPWDVIYQSIERWHPRFRKGCWQYRERWGVWPSWFFLLIFSWMELVWDGRTVPEKLALAACLYSFLTWGGMYCFGRQQWLEKGEMFHVVFGLLARFAPLRIRVIENSPVIGFRPCAVGLLERITISPSAVALVLLLLSTVSFDGFMETPLWARVDFLILTASADSWLWTTLHLQEVEALRGARTLGLMIFIVLFRLIYALFCHSMLWFSSDNEVCVKDLSQRFVLSLIPIAVAYHIAHYFTFMALGLAALIPLLSDPLGWGWNLWGAASYSVDSGLVGPQYQWYVAVSAVVIGHVLAVYVAHKMAQQAFQKISHILRSQWPMLCLMVGYTMLSLWILSQPIVESGLSG